MLLLLLLVGRSAVQRHRLVGIAALTHRLPLLRLLLAGHPRQLLLLLLPLLAWPQACRHLLLLEDGVQHAPGGPATLARPAARQAAAEALLQRAGAAAAEGDTPGSGRQRWAATAENGM